MGHFMFLLTFYYVLCKAMTTSSNLVWFWEGQWWITKSSQSRFIYANQAQISSVGLNVILAICGFKIVFWLYIVWPVQAGRARDDLRLYLISLHWSQTYQFRSKQFYWRTHNTNGHSWSIDIWSFTQQMQNCLKCPIRKQWQWKFLVLTRKFHLFSLEGEDGRMDSSVEPVL